MQEALNRDPRAGDLYVFRGRRGDLLKVIWQDGQGDDMKHHSNVWDQYRTQDAATGFTGLQGDIAPFAAVPLIVASTQKRTFRRHIGSTAVGGKGEIRVDTDYARVGIRGRSTASAS